MSAPAGKKVGEKQRFPPAAGAEKSVAAGFFRACGPAGGAEHAAWRRNKRFCAWLWRNPPGRMRGRRCGPVALIRIGKRGRSPCRIFPSRRAAGGERRRGGQRGGPRACRYGFKGQAAGSPRGRGKGFDSALHLYLGMSSPPRTCACRLPHVRGRGLTLQHAARGDAPRVQGMSARSRGQPPPLGKPRRGGTSEKNMFHERNEQGNGNGHDDDQHVHIVISLVVKK